MSGAAFAQSVDSHYFEFSDTLETVGMEDALGSNSELIQSKSPFLFRASLDYARDSLSATRVVNNPISIVDHMYSITLGGGVVLLPRVFVGMTGSLHHVRLSDQYVSGQFDASSWKLGDVAIHAKIRLTPDNSKINVALRPFVGVPSGSDQYLVSYDSFRWGGRLLADMSINHWSLYFHSGISHASDAQFLSLDERTFLDVGLGTFYKINSKFGVNAEWLQSISISEVKNGQNPTQVNVGIRYDTGSTKVFVGAGVQGFDFTDNNRPYVFYAGIKQPFGSKKPAEPIATSTVVNHETVDPEFIKATEEIQTMVVYFDNNRAKVKSDQHESLNHAAKLMKEYGGKIQYLVLHGHTDPRGDETYNKRLSQRRAQAVKDYLVEQGVNEHAILIDGYGESLPKTTEEKDYRTNRRVEFKVVGK